ncbi:MAG: UDP-N-acetylmuramate:L-alanyl-gamma-D-glutamyl-meso-diaminopimelate ligase [Polyangiales bacterium]
MSTGGSPLWYASTYTDGGAAAYEGRHIHIHLIGVCGTGMGSFAGLLKQAGHRVTGSDTAFYPPMGEALARWGIEVLQGYDPAHLQPAPDLVVVGNVCRPSNPEARAAIDSGLRYLSFPAALRAMFLQDRRSFVVAGTHGKTTTSALLAFLLDATGQAPGFLIGGIAADFPESFRAGGKGAPFVIEGDEYDSAFFEKSAKFLQYAPEIALIASIEHDHIDIYPDMQSYRRAFEQLVALLPEHGLLVVNAADPEARAVASAARCRISHFALEGEDTRDVTPEWLAAPCKPEPSFQPFDLFFGGSSCGRVMSPLPGRHNVKNALAAIAMAAAGTSVSVQDLTRALPRFSGVRRRQELRGVARGVRIYDDFAHHPTAVAQTLDALRGRHPSGTLFAVFEPRSATASRNLHQTQYAEAFASADAVLLAEVGRAEIPETEKLDVRALAIALRQRGANADTPGSVDAIVEQIAARAEPGDTVVVMSNGAFGQIHEKLLARLAIRVMESRL